MGERIISWFSCGGASAVATKMALREHGEATVAYCETGAEHPDNERFLADCARWFNRPIERLRNPDYDSTWDVFEKRRYLAGIHGAQCTTLLKVHPRLLFQRPTDTHVFGYTNDRRDIERAALLRENYPELKIETPLIERGIDKANCLGILQAADIALPVLYGLGFHNNNCIPCVKATSPNYWALMRKHFPAEFGRMAKLGRDLDVRLTRIKGERRFIDEIPTDWPTTNPIAPACDFLCHTIEQDLREPRP